MYVTPAPGRCVPDPDRRDLLPEAGREVPESAYWQRRVADNDVVLGEPPKAETKTSKKA